MPSGDVVLVDTGPLVALFDPSDRDHERCKDELGRMRRRRLVTTSAVATEVTHLLAFSTQAQLAFLDFLCARAVELEPFGLDEVSKARALMGRYANLPMDFADATLVVLAERLQTLQVFCLDSDFRVYRVGRRAFDVRPR